MHKTFFLNFYQNKITKKDVVLEYLKHLEKDGKVLKITLASTQKLFILTTI